MSYATISDVERWTPARAPFTANSKPSATQVVGLIGDMSAKIDGSLADEGYSVPIVATLALPLMTAVVAQMTAAAVEQVAPNGTAETRKLYMEMSDAAQKALLAGVLPGVEKGATGGTGTVRSGPGSFPTARFNLDDTVW